MLLVPIPPLNNFSKCFFRKIAIFGLLKKIARLDFQSILKKENNAKIVGKNLVFPRFPYPNFEPIVSLRFSACDVSP